MRVMFFGSGEFGLPTLGWLHERHEVVAVVSQPDRPAGRKRVLTPTPVAAWALERGLPLLREGDVNRRAFVEQVAALEAEASVVIAFGQKLGPALIEAMGRLAVNLHASLLPVYRGAAPINWAMIHGEARTGVSVIGLAQRMDAGAVYATEAVDIDPRETAGELHDRLAGLGPAAVERVLEQLEAGRLQPMPQDHSRATRAPKLSKADGTTGFDMPAAEVRARVHGLTPWPGCRVRWTREGQQQGVLTLHRVADRSDAPVDRGERPEPGGVLEGGAVVCGQGVVELLALQKPGGRVMGWDEFVRGTPVRAGDVLAAV
jgi:methionyl-tRNA formyltransferase